jgi:hypothetical protein
MMPPVNIPLLDEQRKDFYQLIGQCIKAWATVEGKLFDICEILLQTRPHFVSVIFYRTPTISARVDLTHELLAVRFPKARQGNQEVDQPVMLEWKDIKTEITRLLPQRNSLAHDPVIMNINVRTPNSFETATSPKERLRGKEAKRVEHTGLRPHLSDVNGISLRLENFINRTLQAQP